MLADTARLAVELNLSGNLGPGVAKAEQQLSGLNRTAQTAGGHTSRLSGAFGTAGSAAGKFGGALSHAGGQLKSLAFGPLGMLGVTGGLLTLGGAIGEGIHKAQEFGATVSKLGFITGMSIERTSALAAAFDHFGLSGEQAIKIAGFFEKTMGKLNDAEATAGASAGQLRTAQENVTKAHEKLTLATMKLNETEAKKKVSASQLAAAQIKVRDATVALTDAEAKLAEVQSNKGGVSASKAAELQKKYGVQLLDTKGKALDFETVLLNVADYYKSNAQAADKAQLAAQLFGRGYVQLIPILKAGRQGILDAEQAAKDFGLTLTADNIAALAKAKAATRDWGDALGGLELQIGLQLLPSLTDLTKTATQFVAQNRDQIVGFFREGAKFAGQMGKAIKDYVVPTFGLIKSGWEAIPEPIRQVVLAGIIGGKVSKFLFNFGPLDLAKTLGGGLFGQFLARGSPLNPMFVKEVGLPGVGGGIPGGGGMSGLAKVALIGEAIGLVAAVEGVREQLSSDNTKFAGAIADQTKQYLAQNPSKADLENSLGAIDKGIRDLRANPLNVLVQGDALDKLTGMRADVAAQLALFHTRAQASTAGHEFDAGANQEFNDQSPAMVKAVTGLANFIRDQRERPDGVNATKLVAARVDALTAVFRTDLARLIGATKDNDIRKVAAKITDALVKGRQGDPTLVSTQNRLSELKDAVKAMQTKKLHTHDPETARILGNDIAKLNRKIADRELVLRQFQKEQAILASSESTSRKLTDLTAIQRYLKNTGHPHAAATVAKAIADMKARLAQTTTRAGEVAAAAIRHKKQLVDVNVSNTVHVTTNVSARQTRTAEVVVKRYGNTAVGWT